MNTQLKNSISNQFNIKWWNQKKKINFKDLPKLKKITIKIIGIKYDKKKLKEDEIIKKIKFKNYLK
jgi:hypothetical protein